MTANEAKGILAADYLPATTRRLIDFIHDKPANQLEIARHLGMQTSSAWRLIDNLRKRGVVCVAEYSRDKAGRRVRLFGLGTKDVPAPKKYSAAERSRAYRERIKPLTGTVQLGVWGL